MKDYICIGVPYSLGKHNDPANSVDALRESEIAAELNTTWVDVDPVFEDDVDPIVAVNIALGETINQYPDKIPLIFAADCTSCWGAMKGLESSYPAILWYDAHGDFNTPETSPSGYLGGMPLAALVGLGNTAYMNDISLSLVDELDVILTDARNLDPLEAKLVENSSVEHLPNIEQLLTIDLPTKPLYIHFDLDVIDSGEMPALGYPEPNGPSLAEVVATLRRVRDVAHIAGVLFALYDNSLPDAQTAQEITLSLVRTITGLQD